MITLFKHGEPVFGITEELADQLWIEAFAPSVYEACNDEARAAIEANPGRLCNQAAREAACASLYLVKKARDEGRTLESVEFTHAMHLEQEPKYDVQLARVCWEYFDELERAS